MGPKTESAIAQVDPRLEGAIEYSGWLAPLSRLLLYLLKFLHSYVHNYGLAIVLLTIAIKLMLNPFSFKGKHARKKQEEYQRKLAYIQQKYKNEPELLARERADLIRKHGMPGLGAIGAYVIAISSFYCIK